MPDRGRRPELSDDDILEAVRTAADEYEHVLTTSEINEFLPYSMNGTRDRLDKLANDGKLMKKKFGTSVGWWLPTSDADTKP